MGRFIRRSKQPRLERSCKPPSGDWIKLGPSCLGLERIEAFFAGHAYDPHRHDTYAIGYTISGVQRFDYRGASVDSLPGNVLVLHPDERHDGRAGIVGGFHYRMLYVEPHLIQCALGAKAKSLPFVRSAASADIRLASALRHALGEWTRRWEALETDQIVLGIADALLALDATAQRASAPIICARAVECARQFLDANHDRTVASEELESLTGLDRFTLARHFRARFGTSPYRYLTMRRLDRTRHRIRDGYTLAEAATVNGFADQSHMTRQFKQAYGISPGRWQALTRPVRAAALPSQAVDLSGRSAGRGVELAE